MPLSERTRSIVIPRAHGGLGYAIPAVVGAKIARPNETVVCLTGDGSFGMSGTELETIGRLNLPVTLASWPGQPVRMSAWLGLGYVSLFSMWLGFFAWYRGLAMGGAVRVSQVQLVQPFLALLFAVPVLGETLEPATVAFSLAVIATVFLGKKMPVEKRSPA